MKKSFDQTTDYSLREFNEFIKKADFVPDYVKNAKVAFEEDLSTLPKTAFADEGNRTFPKNSAANTFLSYIHLVNKEAGLKEQYSEYHLNSIEKNIKQAADIFGITEDLNNYRKQYIEKEAVEYLPRAVFEAKLGEQEIELFPFKTAADFSQCAAQFARDYKNLPFEWRKEAAENFVKIARELEVDELPDIICKYAGLFYSNPEHVKTELNRRALRSTCKEAKETYIKLAELVDSYNDINDYMKTAEICYFLEKKAGIHDNAKTASLFGDPVDQIFNVNIEKVANMLNVVKVGEEYFRIADLMEVDGEVYKQAFGIDKLADSGELRDVMSTVPLSDMQLFRELSGIQSV